MKMKVNVYKSLKFWRADHRLYVIVPDGKRVNEVSDEIRKELGDDLGETKPFKTVEIAPGQKRIALNVEEALKSLNEKGYYLQHVELKSSFMPSPASAHV